MNYIYELANIVQTSDMRKLLHEYNDCLSRAIPFTDSLMYLFSDDMTSVECYRYIKGRVYDYQLDFEHFEDTLVEYAYLSKEPDTFIQPRLLKYRDFYSKEFYDGSKIAQVSIIPLINGLQVHGVFLFRYDSQVEILLEDLSLSIEILNIKLLSDRWNKEKLFDLDVSTKVFDNEEIVLYSVSKLEETELDKVIKRKHEEIDENTSTVFEHDSSQYSIYKLSSEMGYVKDITREFQVRKRLYEDVYVDKELNLYNRNKVELETTIRSRFSLVMVDFDMTYLNDVLKHLSQILDEQIVSFIDEKLVIMNFTTDKRSLNKFINSIKDCFSTILTLNYKIGCLIYPKDYSHRHNLINVLTSITDSDHTYYDRSVHFEAENLSVRKKRIVESIKGNTVKFKLFPIVDMNETVEAYKVMFPFEYDDLRIELAAIKLVINRMNEASGKYNISLSKKLIDSVDFIEFLSSMRIPTQTRKRIIFTLPDNRLTSALESRKYPIAREASIEDIFLDNSTDYLFTRFNYNDDSNLLMDFLSKVVQNRGIKVVFKVDTLSDYRYLRKFNFGYVITDKFVFDNE